MKQYLLPLLLVVSNMALADTLIEHSDMSEHEWYKQQHNMVNGNCCGLGDAHILEWYEWKNSLDHYEVKINDKWFVINKSNMRDVTGDPTNKEPLKGLPNPSGKATVWYKFYNENDTINNTPSIYCFSPWETMQ